MFPTLAGGAGEALDKTLNQLRACLLATAATAQAAGRVDAGPDAPPARRCHTSGASRGTDTAA
jgi:hypothetical protein